MYQIDGKGNIYKDGRLVWSGSAAAVLRLYKEMGKLEERNEQLLQENHQLRNQLQLTMLPELRREHEGGR